MAVSETDHVGKLGYQGVRKSTAWMLAVLRVGRCWRERMDLVVVCPGERQKGCWRSAHDAFEGGMRVVYVLSV